MAAQESFLVGVEDGNQRYFRQVESLAQEVYADEDIIHAGAQSVENLYAVHGLRPTGLLDPLIKVKPSLNQIDDLMEEIQTRIERGERTLGASWSR